MLTASKCNLKLGPVVGGCVLTWLMSTTLLSQMVAPCHESSGKTFCHIDKPYIKRHLTEYPKIKFADRDLITIKAGGCVQTGGKGKTWKRYVDPSGPNSDQFYHGLIWVPGATIGLERIQTYNDKKVWVNNGCGKIKPEDLFLRLGYEDDHYGDNGYDGHDDGTEDQCKDVDNAYVDLEIEHNGIRPDTDPPAPLDLERPESCEDYDPNLLPLNPRWGWQRTNPPELPDPILKCTIREKLFEDPRCSSQHPIFDLPSGSNSVVCGVDPGHNPYNKISGHVNYFPAVYTGAIDWDEHSGGLFGDDDYNFNLTPPRSAGLTVYNDRQIGIEFDSDETIDYFDTPWWNLFHETVDADNDSARRMIREKQAIVVGLAGLDCQHDCRSEIHPVFGLAMRVEFKILSFEPFTIEETWAMFVRNTGDEGFCSSQGHHLYLLDDTFSFLLPEYVSSSRYSILGTSVFKSDNPSSAWSTEQYGNNGVRINFLLPDNQAATMIHGELHIKVTFRPGTEKRSYERAPIPSEQTGNETFKIENRLAALSHNLTKEQLDYYNQMTKTNKAKRAFRVPMVPNRASLFARARRTSLRNKKHAVGQSLHDSRKEVRDRKKFEVGSELLGKTGLPTTVSPNRTK